MPETILFYGSHLSHEEFSNFYMRRFVLDGKEWRSAEHYYQAMKSLDKSEQEAIRDARKPNIAKSMGRKVKCRKDWESIKVQVMEKAVYAKFSQNSDLKKILLDTGDAVIHEDSPNDFIWGWGKGRGEDLLGKVLMKVRQQLKQLDDEL